MNVRVWLRGSGLGRYEEKVYENKIDVDVLALTLPMATSKNSSVPRSTAGDWFRSNSWNLGATATSLTSSRPTRDASRARPSPICSRSWIPPNDGRSQ